MKSRWVSPVGVTGVLLAAHPGQLTSAGLQGHNVLELGSGGGVGGILAKMLGAENMVMTDGDAEVVDLLQKNVVENAIEASVHSLWWGDQESMQQFTTDFPEKFNRLIAGDVLYKQSLLELFFTTVAALLSKDEGSFMLLCHIPRAGVQQEMVIAEAARHGLRSETVEADLAAFVTNIPDTCNLENAENSRIHRFVWID